MEIKTIQDIERLIVNSVLENTSLEYKGGIDIHKKEGKKDWRCELVKDVSAMANANGGTIIYGIQETKYEGNVAVPEKITPVNASDISKERLEQVIYSNISPKIDGIEIICLILDDTKPNEVVYIVNVPKGTTAHQNTIDCKYYKRRNAIIEALEDYEIRDIMNRNTVPNINLELEIEKRNPIQAFVLQPVYNPMLNVAIPQMVPQYATVFTLNCKPNNVGTVIAENMHYFIEMPENFVANPNRFDIVDRANGYITIHRENIFCDVLEGSTPQNMKFGNPRVVPILPHTTGVFSPIILSNGIDFNSTAEIRWRLHADCAPQKSGIIKFSDIPRKL